MLLEDAVSKHKHKKFRSIKAENFLKDKFLYPSWPAKNRLGCGCANSESCSRFIKLTRFACVCGASLLQMMAPWMLCTLEVVAVVCIYGLGTSASLILHHLPEHQRYHWRFRHSLEDIVSLSIIRAFVLSIMYAVGMRCMHRPYLYTSYLLAALCFPTIVIKTILFCYGQDAVPAACLFGLTGLFCWLHVFAARRSAEWVRRRAQLGLTGYSCPWDESPEDGWTALRRAPDMEEMTKSRRCDGPEWGEDVSPETLADVDSLFVDVGGIRVHYKEALPLSQNGIGGSGSSSSSCSGGGCAGIVLIHSFGGGVVSWRHVLEPLARQTGLRVVAYDRPAFGLTSRPVPLSEQDNPYTMESQARFILDFCCQIGLHEVILAGHADGSLLALKANALLASESSAACSGAYPARTPMDITSPTPLSTRPPSPPLPQDRDTTHTAASGSPSKPSSPALTVGDGTHARGAGGGSITVAEEVQGLGLSRRQLSISRKSSLDDSPACSEGEPMFDAASQFGSVGSTSSFCPPFMSTSSSCSFHTPAATSVSSLSPAPYLTPISSSAALNSSSTSQSHCIDINPRPLPSSNLQVPCEGMAVCASQAATADNAEAGGASSSSSALASVHRGSSTRHRRAQVAAWTSGQPPLQPPSLHAWTPSHHSCRPLKIIGLALLHPDLSGSLGPSMTRLLARSKLGRSILKPLLRSEVGEVANPRAWYNPKKLTMEVVELHKAPVEGWCEALIETMRLRSSSQKSDLDECINKARSLPILVLTGLHDLTVPPARADQLAQSLPLSRVAVLAECGHLSHEEVPVALLQQVHMFCSQVYS